VGVSILGVQDGQYFVGVCIAAVGGQYFVGVSVACGGINSSK
jgi:hypothetical protein